MLSFNPGQIHCMGFFPSEHLHGYITATASSLALLQMTTHAKMAHSSKSNIKAHPSLAIYFMPSTMTVWKISLVKPTSFRSAKITS